MPTTIFDTMGGHQGEELPMAARPEPVSAADLNDAAAACDFPLVIWQLPDTVIRILNTAAEALLGIPKDQVVGRRAPEFFSRPDVVELSASALASGALSATLAKRELIGKSGQTLPVWVWTRGVEIAGEPKGAVSLVMPETEVGRLGADPGRPWRALADVVIGMADASWRVVRISSDVNRVLGARPKDVVGMSLRDLVHPDDVDGIGQCDGCDPRLPMHGRLRRPDGTWVDAGFLFATYDIDGEEHVCFAFIVHAPIPARSDRVAELEVRLRQIADELRTAQAMEVVEALPVSRDAVLGDLSSRQWEILSRLLRGQRVGTIARELYLSETTVRNHLSAIYQRFDVHSQRELLDLLGRR